MSVKLVVIGVLGILALALLCLVAYYATKAQKDSTVVDSAMKVVKAIVTALCILIGAGATSVMVTGCVAKRSITVQGSIIKSQSSPDSTRIIISSQETYTGRKKGAQ